MRLVRSVSFPLRVVVPKTNMRRSSSAPSALNEQDKKKSKDENENDENDRTSPLPVPNVTPPSKRKKNKTKWHKNINSAYTDEISCDVDKFVDYFEFIPEAQKFTVTTLITDLLASNYERLSYSTIKSILIRVLMSTVLHKTCQFISCNLHDRAPEFMPIMPCFHNIL